MLIEVQAGHRADLTLSIEEALELQCRLAELVRKSIKSQRPESYSFGIVRVEEDAQYPSSLVVLIGDNQQ